MSHCCACVYHSHYMHVYMYYVMHVCNHTTCIHACVCVHFTRKVASYMPISTLLETLHSQNRASHYMNFKGGHTVLRLNLAAIFLICASFSCLNFSDKSLNKSPKKGNDKVMYTGMYAHKSCSLCVFKCV